MHKEIQSNSLKQATKRIPKATGLSTELLVEFAASVWKCLIKNKTRLGWIDYVCLNARAHFEPFSMNKILLHAGGPTIISVFVAVAVEEVS